MIDQEILTDARKLLMAGADRETILVFLRDRQFDKIDSINSIRMLYNLSMPEAKEVVDHSDAWSDRFYTDMHFRDLARRALRDLATSNDKDLPKIHFLESKEPEE